MSKPHPFTRIQVGDLVSITGWMPIPGGSGYVINFPLYLESHEKTLSNANKDYFRLEHGQTVIGIVSKKIKIKKREYIHILIKDKMIYIERGWIHNSNFSIGKIFNF